MPRAALLAAFVSALLLTLTSTAALAAWSHGTGSPTTICPSGMNQTTTSGATLADGSGGFYVAFDTTGSGLSQLFLEHITAAGTVALGWPAGGVALSSSAFQGGVRLFYDFSGGVFVVWQDYRFSRTDIFAQHVTGAGAIAGGWPAGGVDVSFGTVEHASFSACNDFSGGLFIVFDYLFGAGDVDLYAAHLAGNGTFTTTAINTNSLIQQHAAICPDGSSGFYVTYEDNTAGNFDLRAARYNAAISPIFTNKLICDPPGDQQNPQITLTGSGAYVFWIDCRFGTYCQILYDYVTDTGSVGYDFGFSLYNNPGNSQGNFWITRDNTGGYFLAWLDARPSNPGLYLQHFISGSALYSGWPVGGLFVGPGNPGASWEVSLATDGNSGVVIAWSDENNLSGALVGAHYDAHGNARPLTSVGGRLIEQTTSMATGMTVVDDNLGGGFVTFMDNHLGRPQVFAQHFDPYIVLGDASPVTAGIKDIKADQGGHVRMTWNASWLDNPIDYGIGSYWVWRQAPLTLAAAAARAGSSALFRPASAPGANYAWEFLAQQPANQSVQYSYVAPTTTDSITGHNPYTVFMVEAHAAEDSRAFWQSAPDSGYSVDNIGPAMPAPFLGTYAAGNTSMNWGPNGESDLYGYRLYRGTTVGFTPNPGNRIATPTGTAYVDPGVPPSIYKLTAIDVHGNESLPATLIPSGVTSVDSDLPRELAFALASANPSHGTANFRLALPRATSVTLAIYDVSGRQVRMVADGAFAAGVQTLAWNGRFTSGEPAPSGIYLARLRAENREFVKRIVLAR